jgi:raffinose/stachyose/melibiose transport system substrate-binding protein
MTNKQIRRILLLVALVACGMLLGGCGSNDDSNGKVVIELVQYKPEAVDIFNELEEKFNATHDDIELKIDSPNDAMTILKTRFIREDNPDIIGIGGDINYSNFLDAKCLWTFPILTDWKISRKIT